MKLKKWGVMLLTGMLAVGVLAGCGASEKSTAPASAAKKDGRVLVVYYSASGNTKAVSETIASTAKGDIMELQPATPYTSEDLNYRNNNSRVVREHDDASLQDVKLVTNKAENWDSYDTVFIGYPIWWGIAAWPVNDFVKNNDFSGKTVIPFATAVSSGMGESGTLLQQMAGTGNWQDGKRFYSGASSSEVQQWVKDLGLAK